MAANSDSPEMPKCHWYFQIWIFDFIFLNNYCLDFFHQGLNPLVFTCGGLWQHKIIDFFSSVGVFMPRKFQRVSIARTYLDIQIHIFSTPLASLLLGRFRSAIFFTGRRLFRKILFSLLPNPDRPITPKMLLMNTDLGFQIHITPKLHPRFLPSMAQSTIIYLRMNTQ